MRYVCLLFIVILLFAPDSVVYANASENVWGADRGNVSRSQPEQIYVRIENQITEIKRNFQSMLSDIKSDLLSQLRDGIKKESDFRSFQYDSLSSQIKDGLKKESDFRNVRHDDLVHMLYFLFGLIATVVSGIFGILISMRYKANKENIKLQAMHQIFLSRFHALHHAGKIFSGQQHELLAKEIVNHVFSMNIKYIQQAGLLIEDARKIPTHQGFVGQLISLLVVHVPPLRELCNKIDPKLGEELDKLERGLI